LEAEDWIKEYAKEVQQKYPDLSLEQISRICKHPFNFAREKMKTETLPEIRIKYLGTFKVTLSKAGKKLEQMRKMVENGTMHAEKYEHYKKLLTNFIDRHGKSRDKPGQCDQLLSGEPEV
jgi:hypothetical protein